jgi:hypothetical protein
MLGDGICDCCDGSDEPEGQCPAHAAAYEACLQLAQQRARSRWAGPGSAQAGNDHAQWEKTGV